MGKCLSELSLNCASRIIWGQVKKLILLNDNDTVSLTLDASTQ